MSLGGKTMKQSIAMRPEIYNYAIDGDYVDDKATQTKKCVIK